jgi:hypothetical protein
MNDTPIILLVREQSTMVSSWNEMLCLERLPKGKWTLGVYGYEWLGSINDLIPEDELYDEDGKVKVPDEYEGHRIRGLADGEYLETDELVQDPNAENITFDRSSLGLVREYTARNRWDRQPDFELAWKKLMEIIGV